MRDGVDGESITSRNSTNEPGQPCRSSSGVALSTADLTCRKWIRWPSTSVVNCGYPLMRFSCARQSKSEAQYSATRRR